MRPSLYTDKTKKRIHEKVLEILKNGGSIEDIPNSLNISRGTFYRWVKTNPDFRFMVYNARGYKRAEYGSQMTKIKLSAYTDKVLSENGDVEAGKILGVPCYAVRNYKYQHKKSKCYESNSN